MSSSSKKDGAPAPADTKKFMFDTNDFADAKAHAQKHYTEEQLALARSQGIALGKAEALKEAKALQETHIAALLEKATLRLSTLIEAELRRETEKSADAVRLAMKITHKLLPQFALRYSLQEIEGLILQSLDTRREEPRIAVHVPTAHLEYLKEKMDALALEKGYAGRVILLADDALPPTDCRIEWADGGIEKIYERLYAQIENELTKAIGNLQAPTQDQPS